MFFSLLNDRELASMGENIIFPFTPAQVREGLSYGLGGHTYDLRLSGVQLYIIGDNRSFLRRSEIDPKNFNPLENARALEPEWGGFFLLPPLSYALGFTIEKLDMPNDLIGVVLGKSTYARSGLILNTTVIDAGFKGHVTLEFFNSTRSYLRVYSEEGICQLQFLRGQPADRPYDNSRKYQNQESAVVFPKVLKRFHYRTE
jgi:dCTP deaminase